MRPDRSASTTMSGAWARPFIPGGQQVARFHRETDRRLRRTMMVALVCAGIFVGAVLGLVGLKVHQVRLSYRLDALRTARNALEERNRLLRVELATLRSLARIEGKARTELGMVSPARDQVQLAREFVNGGSGLGAIGGPRTASAERPRLADAEIR